MLTVVFGSISACNWSVFYLQLSENLNGVHKLGLKPQFKFAPGKSGLSSGRLRLFQAYRGPFGAHRDQFWPGLSGSQGSQKSKKAKKNEPTAGEDTKKCKKKNREPAKQQKNGKK